MALVTNLYDKFELTNTQTKWGGDREKLFRVACMTEEITEYLLAKTGPEELDALIDIIIFAFGTIERHGWSEIFHEAFNEVMKANLAKEVGQGKKSRGSFLIDLVKPGGWVAPCHDKFFAKLPNK